MKFIEQENVLMVAVADDGTEITRLIHDDGITVYYKRISSSMRKLMSLDEINKYKLDKTSIFCKCEDGGIIWGNARFKVNHVNEDGTLNCDIVPFDDGDHQ